MSESRWAFMSRKVIGPSDNPMLIRWRLIQTPYCGLYLHFIHREDLDRVPHDHPWTFWSLVLRGSYVEEYYEDSRRVSRGPYTRRWGPGGPSWNRCKRFHHFPLGACHRIIKTQGKTTTLVVVGHKKRTWGFYGKDGFIDWREYDEQVW